MAFWGTEVKPGKPFTHTANDSRGRLHVSQYKFFSWILLSWFCLLQLHARAQRYWSGDAAGLAITSKWVLQATLGIGTATKKSVVQCNVGSKSPVFLCSLFPEKAECCQLNLEFEEADEVVFSVIGPRSVHLTGYFFSSGRHYNLEDDSESYGEDIADTETERSTGHSDEDMYEDSFIDDSDPKVIPSSPFSDGREIEETPGRRKPKDVKESWRRLRKKYQSSESDGDLGAQEHMLANGSVALDSESEDMLPISSICKGTPASRSEKLEAEEKVIEENGDTNPAIKNTEWEAEEKTDKKGCETSYSDSKDEGNCFTIAERKLDAVDDRDLERPKSSDPVMRSSELGPESSMKPKKKKKALCKKGTHIDTNGCFDVLKENNAQRDDRGTVKMVQTFPVRNEEHQKTSNYNSEGLPPSIQVSFESNVNPKKRKKKGQAEEKSFEARNDCNTNVKLDDNTLQEEVKPNIMSKDLPVRNEQTENQVNHKAVDDDIFQSFGEDQSKEKKKKKKKRKIREDGMVTDMETAFLSIDQKSVLLTDTEKSDSKLSQPRSLSNGVEIEELENGKPDGKVAASGKKISVFYVGKLKENGQVFDSNLGGALFKFRLGGKDVIDGFNIGIEGMQVGEKRRIIIPPSMGYGSEGDGKKVPPNSPLIFDVELIKVHR